ncbi:PHD finger protein ALFIN-LIKE 1-like [Megalobrama amblycephala]|uniref:PHD finger protein ALFIN-LIKE 1-like n=1 Tax=Megalobrama amblycephala TaxID=75352 RepID=UPI0020144F1A|nr:PHD finger protein ALFIN-LIKE 1-like [Megalobrama amblycephala]
MEIALTLLHQSDDLSELCHYCGEAETFEDTGGETETFEDSEVLWIACDYCGRWFHLKCVGNPSTEKEYKCVSCNK